MRIRKSFEQAICILLLIGTSEGPLKSHELSKMLDVSDSYLKKVTRQLVVAGLITSKASKLGGFILNKKQTSLNLTCLFILLYFSLHINNAPAFTLIAYNIFVMNYIL